MNRSGLLKQACTAVLSERLMTLRGERSQAVMAEKCAMSQRHYSDLERRIACGSAVTMLRLYSAGMDLNRWAEDALKLYGNLCLKENAEKYKTS